MKHLSLLIKLIPFLLFAPNLTYAQDSKDFSVAIGQNCMSALNGLRELCGISSGECEPLPEVQITVKVDDVNINSIVINKGNCKSFAEQLGAICPNCPGTQVKKFPQQAKFGDRIDLVVTCHPILVELNTNLGKYEYTVE